MLLISAHFKSLHLWFYGVHYCLWNGQVAHLERHNQCWKLYTGTKVAYRGLSFRAGLANFSKTMLNRILHLLQKHGFESGQGRLQIFHRLKTFCTLWIKIWQRRARTVEQVQSHTRQEWGNITLPKVLLLMFTNYCYKKRGCYTVLSIALSQLFLDIFLEPSNS